jgi:hypothetical protein
MPVNEPWIYHEWMTGVLFYKIYCKSGSLGLQVLKYVLALAALWFATRTARMQGASEGSILLCMFLSVYVFAFGYSPVRAQAFTYLFFAVTLYLLEKSRRDKNKLKWLTLIVPIQLLWCNLHGGFVAGLGVVLIYATGEALSRRNYLSYLAVLIPATMITLVNPYGLDYWRYTIDAVTMQRPDITEWLSVYSGIKQDLSLGAIYSFITLAFFSLLLFLVYNRKDITAGLVLAVTAYLGFSHMRHIVFFAIAFITFIPLPFARFWDQLKKKLVESGRIRFASILIAFAIVLVVGDSIYSFNRKVLCGAPFSLQTMSKGKDGKIEYHFPSGAVEYIQSNGIKGNILPFFDWGEYLIWHLYPNCKVGMDGRYETVYPERIHKAYFNFIYGREGWKEFLNGYPHEMILVHSLSKIHSMLKREENWIEVYRGQGSSLFIKRGYWKNEEM